ncbi:family 10 glycosylhydrolase [Blastopirellula sp. J2-11]|uniref:family 10 glycosylhydrolase n=1 Tax=Blastopirellula sp. J2-11 TaxID=2943192 RepID=UPI0021CA981F|nr:family 10 glycosylhydrolase [Blastopirellula sp. J2-11]UUO08331.1 family 10 glycosylhydrolase [Blastopirellula sp. J2-11]
MLCNDGGTLAAPDREAPVGIDGLIQSTIAPLQDTMIDTLYWQLGTDPFKGTKTARLTDWYSHQSRVGARWGSDREAFRTAGEWRIYENTRDIESTGTDVPTVVIDAGHKAGIAVYLSLRMNDSHDFLLEKGLQDENMSPIKKQHPDWVLDEKSVQWGRTGLNYAIPEVRAYRMALIEEAITQYDADGIQLDFCRHPRLFKQGEEQTGAALVTQMLRQTRQLAKQKEETSDRNFGISVRVPHTALSDPTFEIETWIKEHLVDYLIVAETFGWHYRLPIEPYVKLANQGPVKVLAQNLCAFKQERVRSARVLFGENNNYYSTEQFRAVAARHWMAGADGMFIWNQHFLPYSHNAAWDPQHWKEIGDPKTLESLDKHYIVGPHDRGGNLPITLNSAGDSADISIEIADKFDGPTKPSATLRLTIEQLTRLDDVTFLFNGAMLSRSDATVRFNYNECVLDFDVSESIHRGDNKLKITVNARNPHVRSGLKVFHVEALVSPK